MFGGEDMVLSVNDVQTERAELFYLHRLPSIFSGLEKVPEEEIVKHLDVIDWILIKRKGMIFDTGLTFSKLH